MKTILNPLLSLLLTVLCLSAFAQTPGGAKLDLDEGKLDKAKEKIDKAIEDPKHNVKSKTWYFRGLIYAAIANSATNPLPALAAYANLDTDPVQKALDSYKKAMEMEPEKKGSYKDAEKAIVDLYGPAMQYGIKKYNDKDTESAMKAFLIASQSNPKDLVALVYGGELAGENKKFDIYKKTLETLTALPLADYTAYNTGKDEKQQFKKSDYYAKLAFYYRDQANDADKAIETCKNGMKEFPGDNLLGSLLMELYAKTNKFDDAIKEAENQAQKNPNDPRIFLNLGILYEKAGKEQEALKAYQKSVDLDPKNFDSQYNLAAVFYNKGAAIMSKVNQMDLGEYNKKGKAEEEKAAKEFEKAMPYFEKLYTLKPKEMQVLTPLSTIYKILKIKDKEEKIMKEIASLGDN